MPTEDLHHLRAVGRAASGGPDDFGRFAEVRGTHDRRGDDAELFHILAAEVVEAMGRAAGNAQRLPGPTSMGVPTALQVRTPPV